MSSPYHEGELAIQERVGEVLQADGNGRVIDASILPGALGFIGQQKMAVFTSIAPDGTPWPHVVFGARGFARAEHAHLLEVDMDRALLDRDDLLFEHLAHDSTLGVLLIELGTRRRLRINGRVEDAAAGVWQVLVRESYPNCPKYIQKRQVSLIPDATRGQGGTPTIPGTGTGTRLGAEQLEILAASDTAFVASAHVQRGADASHRGGPPGFLEVLDGRRIRMPDYSGNSMYNTLGNFVAHPRGGLLVMDFEGRRMLQLVGSIALHFDQPDEDGRTGGTGRFWELDVEQWRQVPLPASVEAELIEVSPFHPKHRVGGGEGAVKGR